MTSSATAQSGRGAEAVSTVLSSTSAGTGCDTSVVLRPTEGSSHLSPSWSVRLDSQQSVNNVARMTSRSDEVNAYTTREKSNDGDLLSLMPKSQSHTVEQAQAQVQQQQLPKLPVPPALNGYYNHSVDHGLSTVQEGETSGPLFESASEACQTPGQFTPALGENSASNAPVRYTEPLPPNSLPLPPLPPGRASKGGRGYGVMSVGGVSSLDIEGKGAVPHPSKGAFGFGGDVSVCGKT